MRRARVSLAACAYSCCLRKICACRSWRASASRACVRPRRYGTRDFVRRTWRKPGTDLKRVFNVARDTTRFHFRREINFIRFVRRYVLLLPRREDRNTISYSNISTKASKRRDRIFEFLFSNLSRWCTYLCILKILAAYMSICIIRLYLIT